MNIKKGIRQLINKTGYNIVKLRPPNRKKVLDRYGINVVLDVGASRGQYAQQLRGIGYKGRIISFEPLSSAYAQLINNKKSDALWETFNLALGDKDGEAIINIAGNSYSSSILGMLPEHLKSAPASGYIGQEQVIMSKLDSIMSSLHLEGENIYLKIDTQGFEENILKGALNSLQFIRTIQLEMSLIPLYRGELLFPEMYALLYGKDYRMVYIEPGFSDPQTGRLLQVDGTFHRF